MHELQIKRSGGLSLPRKSVVRLTDRLDMTIAVYRGGKTTIQHQLQSIERNIEISTSCGTDHVYVIIRYEFDLSASFRIFICSENQRNLFCL